ncbi:MAG TPA: hypothetical protein VEX15_04940 [Nocardioidaceae bacterium]|nr:hypothetical protein [Nocardioidaceae bacterium]
MTETAPRPRQVTLASLIAGLGSLLVLVNIFAVMADWGSASIREHVEDALDSAPFGSTRISVDAALEMVRITLMVVAAGCVAAVVLAIYTVRRHRSARVGLTVLTSAWALLSLALGLAGLLLAAIAIGCVILLWSAEARTWFASGTPPKVVATAVPPIPPPNATLPKGMPAVMSTPTSPDEPDQPTLSGSPGAQESSEPVTGGPPAPSGGYSGYGPPPPPPSGYQPYTAYAPAGPPPNPVVPSKRPGTLTAAGIITIVMSSIALLGTGIVAIWFLGDRSSMESNDDFVDMAGDAEIAVEDLVTAIGVMSVIGALLSVAAIVLAAMLLKNKRVRIALVVLTSIAIIASLLAFPLGLLWVIAEILVIVFCFVGGASAWLDAQAYAADRARQNH